MDDQFKAPPSPVHFDVLILGGGFAGVQAAHTLGRLMKRKQSEESIRIGLVSDQNYVVFQPMLPEVAGASLSPLHVINPIRRLCPHAEVYRGAVKQVHLKQRTLTVQTGHFTGSRELSFDHLVFALGAHIDLSRVPGMPEHAFLMQNVGDAMKLRTTVVSRMEEANVALDPIKKKELLTFVVVGGGYSGVETAGQILDLLNGMHRYYHHIEQKDFRVVLVHSQSHLLPTLSNRLGDYAARVLQKRGLEIMLNQRVKAVTARRAYLSSGDVIHTNTIVCTVGNAPHTLIQTLCAEYGLGNQRGRIETDSYLRVLNSHHVWAAGDCAAIPLQGGGYCPGTAQFAMRQGKLLGKNIAATIRHQPLKPFRFQGVGELAAIGHRQAVASIFGLKFSGFTAWWLWRSVYLAKLPGFERKIRVLIDWTLDLFFPRDISLLNPRYTRELQDVYLEPENILFNAGEPAFSFYVLKSGRIELRDGETVIRTIQPGEYFGERSLLGENNWAYRAVATEPSSLIALGSEEFKSIIASSSAFRRLIRKSSSRYLTADAIADLLTGLPSAMLDMPITDVMTHNPHTVSREMTIGNALQLFKHSRHTLYPLSDSAAQHGYEALLREDLYDFLREPGVHAETTLAGIETTLFPSIRVETQIKDAIHSMIREGRNKLIVVGADRQLQGILSIADIVNLFQSVAAESSVSQ